MPESILTIASGSLADIFEPVSALWTDMWYLVALGIGIPLFFFMVSKARSWFAR